MTTTATGLDPVVRDADAPRLAPAWFRPAVFILAPVTASFLAWWGLVATRELGLAGTMSEALNGFSTPANATARTCTTSTVAAAHARSATAAAACAEARAAAIARTDGLSAPATTVER